MRQNDHHEDVPSAGWEDANGHYEADSRPFHCSCRVAEGLWQARVVDQWGSSQAGHPACSAPRRNQTGLKTDPYRS